MRSESRAELDKIDAAFKALVIEAVAEENHQRQVGCGLMRPGPLGTRSLAEMIDLH